MTGGSRRNVWLRMTDSMGVTESGKRPERPSPRILLFQIVCWFVSTLVWFALAIQTDGEFQVLSAVLFVSSLVVAVGNLVRLLQPRKDKDDSKAGGPERAD